MLYLKVTQGFRTYLMHFHQVKYYSSLKPLRETSLGFTRIDPIVRESVNKVGTYTSDVIRTFWIVIFPKEFPGVDTKFEFDTI